MKILLLTFLLLNLSFSSVKFTPSDVFTEAVKIEEELKIIKEYFNINKEAPKQEEINAILKPKHVWQISYILLIKINTLRSKYNMPIITANSMTPVLNLEPNLVFEQMERVLSELRIFKSRIGIKKKIKEIEKVSEKEPIDVFNKLLTISNELDIINSKEVTPSIVFSEVMRVYEDTTKILNALNLKDKTIPPKQLKENVTPKDVFNYVFKLINQIHRIQKMGAIERVELNIFNKENIKPNDVLILIELIISELQPIKAYLGLKYELTPPAKYYEEKTPSDNIKLIGWIIERLKLIDSLTKG